MESERKEKEVGVLFADISDSSHLFNAYGNERARDILHECIQVMRDVVYDSPGRVVERIGDELLSVFPTADSTARAAVALQVAVAESRLSHRLPSFLSVRIGFHFGAVLVEGDELFGDTIYTANRVCALAKGNQILTTGDTVTRLAAELRVNTRFIERRTLKGKRQVHDVFQMPWDDPLRTEAANAPATPAEDAVLELTHESWRTTLSATRPVCTIGRGERCDFQVELDDVSRVHARIEYRNGHFVLVDLSANGTTVRPERGEARLHREELRLEGSGVIQVSDAQPVEIRYVCRTTPAGLPPSAPVSPSRTPRTD